MHLARVFKQLAMVVLIAPSPVLAGEYLGEFCWAFDNGWIMVAGITRAGDQHFQLNGRVNSSGPGQTSPLNGGAEIFDGQVFLVLDFTGEDDDRMWGGTARGVLDPSSLAGTIEWVETTHFKNDPDPRSAIVGHVGPIGLEPTTCP